MIQMSQGLFPVENPNVPVVPAGQKSGSGANSHQPSWTGKYADLLEQAKIAIIDDEEINIEVVQGYLEQEGYRNFYRTTDAMQAMDFLEEVKPDILLLDVMMPGISGLDILAEMRADKRLCLVPVIVLTACSGPETKLKALKLGSTDFLAKPVDASELLLRMRNVLALKAYQDHLSDYSRVLKEQVEQRTRELVESRQRVIQCLARAAEIRDDDTGQHVVRVGRYAALIGRAMGFDPQRVELLEQAAQLHDIGKIGVPDAVLLKAGKLDPAEMDIIRQHCSFGNGIINPLSLRDVDVYRRHTELGAKLLDLEGYPVLELAGIIAQTHHEKWDGSGYPLGLVGEDIPIEGRITAVADVFDALTSKRPYKPAFSREKSFQILEEGRGSHFDPVVLDAFFSCKDDIVGVQIRYANV